MKIVPWGIAFLLGTSALHAEWKVATVRMSDLFSHCPEVAQYRQQVEQKKQSIAQDVRFKSLQEKREEMKQINIDGRKVLFDYQKLKVKDEKGPEADRVREYRTKLKLAQTQLEALKLEYEDFQKEQLALINQEMARAYRKVLDRLTVAVQQHAATRGFDVVYDVSGNSHVGLPTLLYVKPGISTDITDELKKMVDDGLIK